MKEPTKKALFDVVESSNSILDWCANKSFEEYSSDRKLRRAVEREFSIIGEALNRLRRSEPDIARDIHEISRIIAFRNIVIHGYDTIDDPTVWGIIQRRLPELKDAVLEFLREQGEEI
jgi:uncharacterized protein with HEPN domain